jgi:hypothetical protein
MRTAALAVIAAVLTGCAATAASLPTHDLLSGGHARPAGLINGTLVTRDECVFVQGDPDQLLVIWPRGFDRIGQQVTERGNPVAQVGEFLTLHGGSIDARQYERVRSSIGGSSVPAACATNQYWLATGAEPITSDSSPAPR